MTSRPVINVPSMSWCFILLWINIAVFRTAKCKADEEIFHHIVHVPVLASFPPFWGVWLPYRGVFTPHVVYPLPGYGPYQEYPVPVGSPLHQLNRQAIPVDSSNKLMQNQKKNVIFGDSHLPQCGISETLVRAEGQEEFTRHNFYGAPEEEENQNGTVLLTSREVAGPDLTETAFNEYKGNPKILSTKITYGLPTRKREAPWQVAMFVGGKFHCGASIIGDRHILTAAHCVTAYKKRPHALKLSLGDWDLDTTSDGPNLDAEVKTVKPHSKFNFFNLQNDIAVLELKEKIVFSSRINAICIPPSDLDAEGTPITVTGWGRNEKNLLQTRLHKLTAIVLQNEICADRWSRSGAPRSLIGLATLCMDTQFGDSCKGDSGGPAVMEYPADSGKFAQVGIVSFGSGTCTDSNLPGVYTRVAAFRDWILEQIV